MKTILLLVFTILSLNTIAQVSNQVDTLKNDDVVLENQSEKKKSFSNLSKEEQENLIKKMFSTDNTSDGASATGFVKGHIYSDYCNKPVVLTVQIDMNGDVVDITNIETDVEEQACIYNAKNAVRRMKFPSSTDSIIRYVTITFN